jgi:CheY-like chemotaxis protein
MGQLHGTVLTTVWSKKYISNFISIKRNFMNEHPIYIVDDDLDDNEIITDLWRTLGLPNQLKFFSSGEELISHLKEDDQVPFMIICDVNLPKVDGFQIREILYRDPATRYKTVPFIFWSNSASEQQIKRAYDLGAHGMFIKGDTFAAIKTTFTKIVDYWQSSLKPK